jgi:hypothetical protein
MYTYRVIVNKTHFYISGFEMDVQVCEGMLFLSNYVSKKIIHDGI